MRGSAAHHQQAGRESEPTMQQLERRQAACAGVECAELLSSAVASRDHGQGARWATGVFREHGCGTADSYWGISIQAVLMKSPVLTCGRRYDCNGAPSL